LLELNCMKIINIQKNYNWKKQAVDILNQGGLIIYPTETCYGVGVDATNFKAVEKLLIYKKRPEGKAVSIAVLNQKMAEQYVILNEKALNLYQNFLPGPLTVISESKHIVDQRLEAENGTLGVRIPNYESTLSLIKKFGKPITATSANSASKKTPYSFNDVINNISDKQAQIIDLFLDAGKLPQNPPSTVIETTINDYKILRQGQIALKSKLNQLIQEEISDSKKVTQRIASDLYKNEIKKLLKNYCVVVSLQGELGAGKTQFTKGMGKAMEIKEEIVSPTFNIVREYHGKNSTLIHIDTWRLTKNEDLRDYLSKKYFQPKNLIAIEWSEKVSDLINNLSRQDNIKIINIKLEHLSLQSRKVIFGIS